MKLDFKKHQYMYMTFVTKIKKYVSGDHVLKQTIIPNVCMVVPKIWENIYRRNLYLYINQGYFRIVVFYHFYRKNYFSQSCPDTIRFFIIDW